MPSVSTADVLRLIDRDFGEHRDAARDLLAPLASTHPGAVARVSAAVVKLADGDLDALRQQVGVATTDWRAVISGAEYPQFMQLSRDASPDAKAEAIDADWDAYQTWLNG